VFPGDLSVSFQDRLPVDAVTSQRGAHRAPPRLAGPPIPGNRGVLEKRAVVRAGHRWLRPLVFQGEMTRVPLFGRFTLHFRTGSGLESDCGCSATPDIMAPIDQSHQKVSLAPLSPRPSRSVGAEKVASNANLPGPPKASGHNFAETAGWPGCSVVEIPAYEIDTLSATCCATVQRLRTPPLASDNIRPGLRCSQANRTATTAIPDRVQQQDRPAPFRRAINRLNSVRDRDFEFAARRLGAVSHRIVERPSTAIGPGSFCKTFRLACSPCRTPPDDSDVEITLQDHMVKNRRTMPRKTGAPQVAP